MATDVEDLKRVEQSKSRASLEGAANYELPPSYALSATPPPSYHQAVPSPYRSPAYVESTYFEILQIRIICVINNVI